MYMQIFVCQGSSLATTWGDFTLRCEEIIYITKFSNHDF